MFTEEEKQFIRNIYERGFMFNDEVVVFFNILFKNRKRKATQKQRINVIRALSNLFIITYVIRKGIIMVNRPFLYEKFIKNWENKSEKNT